MTRKAQARRLVAAGFGVALVGTIVVASHALGIWSISFGDQPGTGDPGCPTYSPPFVYPPPTNVKVASPTVAWATGGLRTSDGGAHWRDLSPPELRADAPNLDARRNMYPPGFSDFYLDANDGWEVRTFSSPSACFDHAATFRTSDAGHTWQRSASIQLSLRSRNYAVTQLYFLDSQHGWLWVETGSAELSHFPGLTDGVLFGTSDGGIHWKFLSAVAFSKLGDASTADCSGPSGPLGYFRFESLTTGWFPIWCPASSQLGVMVSQDGGVTWGLHGLPASLMNGSCPCPAGEFALFDASHAVLPVYAQESRGIPPDELLLATSDAGTTWQALPALPNSGYLMSLAFLDATDWWAISPPPGWRKGQGGNDSLYKTTDGGITWTLVQPVLPFVGPVSEMYFLDTSHSWVLQPQGTQPFGAAIAVYTTADGGQAWKSVTAQVDS